MHFFLPKEFIEHVTPTFESSGWGGSGEHPLHSGKVWIFSLFKPGIHAPSKQTTTPLITVFQKKPFFLVHRHLILLFPTATFPSSQTTIHVAPWHAVPATPDGKVNSGQRFHSAAALIPTGCPHWPSDLVRYISIASWYVGCTHSDAFAPMAIYWKSFDNVYRNLSMPDLKWPVKGVDRNV